MADAKWSNDSKFIPQSSIGGTDNIMGLTGSNVNAKYPRYLFGRGAGSAATHNTSTTLTGAEIIGGIIRSTPGAAGVTLTLPTAAQIYSAMGGTPAVGAFIDCIFVNLGSDSITLSKTDANLLITGLVTTVLNRGQSFKLRFTVTNLSPTQITIDGGINTTQGFFVDLSASGDTFLNYLNAEGPIDFPPYTPTEIYVSTNGNDSYTGQQIGPLRHIDYADQNASDGSSVIVAPGDYGSGDFLKRSGVGLFGKSKNNTSLTSSNLLGIDNSQWIATTSPHFEINGITLNGVSSSYFPSIYVEDSTQIFRNGKITPDFNAGLITNLIIENQEISNPHIFDLVDGQIMQSVINGNSVFEGMDGSSVPTYSVIIRDTSFSGTITLRTGYIGDPATEFDISIFNCPGITGISVEDNSLSVTAFNITIDADSMPVTGVTTSTGASISINKITNVSNGVDPETNGFNKTGNYFSYSGYITQNFSVTNGQNQTITGTKNITFGRANASGANGCFLFADSQTLTVLQPSKDYQFVTRAYNGYGFNTGDPKANFHIKPGNTGDLLASINGIISDGNMSNNELNPHISNTSLGLKWKDNSGNVRFGYVMPTVVISSSSQTIQPNVEYIVNNGGSLVTFTLPATMAVGDKVRIIGFSLGLWKIAVTTGQDLTFLSQSVTTSTGSITSTQRFQCMEVTCLQANTIFSVTYASGASYTIA